MNNALRVAVALSAVLIVAFLALYSIYLRASDGTEFSSFLRERGYVPTSRAPDDAEIGDLLLLSDTGEVVRLSIPDMCGIDKNILRNIVSRHTDVRESTIDIEHASAFQISSDREDSTDSAVAEEKILETSLLVGEFFDEITTFEGCEAAIARRVGLNCSAFYTSEMEYRGLRVGMNTSSGCQIFLYEERSQQEIDHLLQSESLARHFQWSAGEQLTQGLKSLFE
jgi:hypothetical protein